MLRRCLDCAVKQTCKNLEILVSDQSPDDEVKKVVEEYQAVDKRVKYVKISPEHGVYGNREYIISNLKNDYLIFIDSDDSFDLDPVELLYKSVAAFPNRICSAYCDIIWLKPDQIIPERKQNKIKEESFENPLSHLINNGPDSICGKILPKKALEGIKVLETDGMEDVQINLKLAPKLDRIFKVEGSRYFYWMNAGSITHLNNFPLLQSYRSYLFMERICKENKVEVPLKVVANILLSKAKLQAVDYSEDFQHKDLKKTRKELRQYLKTHKDTPLSKRAKQQIKLFFISPLLFRFMYRKYRTNKTK